MRFKRWPIVVFLVFVAVSTFIVFCLWRADQNAKANSAKAKPLPPTSITFKRTKFMDGQQTELISHLGLTTGAIEADVGDAEVWFEIDTETWEEGKKPKPNGGCSSRFKGKSKLSFAIRQLQDQEENHVFAISVYDKAQDLEGTFRQDIRVKKYSASSSTHHLEEISEPLELKEGEEAILWAYTINTGRSGGGGSLKEDYLATMARVIAVRVKWTQKP